VGEDDLQGCPALISASPSKESWGQSLPWPAGRDLFAAGPKAGAPGRFGEPAQNCSLVMSDLYFTELTMPAARLGAENPLPPLQPQPDPHARIGADSAIPEEDRRYLGYGRTAGCLPYGLQDDYDRERKPRAFRVAVIENDLLRATFLLELGGCLWSLVHKPSGRELLYVNQVFQPANLAVRNAWFSGGVEWNCGVTGHTPLTCSPMFAAVVRGCDSAPVLRLYEWERIRQVPYQVDAWLPDGSPVLFVRVRIVNPHDAVTPMYWWSNIAVAEKPGLRVLAPAEAAYSFGYRGGLTQVSIPVCDGTDVTYPTNLDRAADFFYRIPDGRRPWIAALDSDGQGLVQTSTARLRGRKLFVWGMGPGGRRWQEFLSAPGRPYLEIQAGLARTQAECLPMPARAEWSWLEAYAPIEADPSVAHGGDWSRAWQHIEQRLEAMLPRQDLEAEYERGAAMADRPPEQILHRGSGWGALERRRRERRRETPFCSDALVFDDASLGDEQSPWLALLDDGALPYQAPDRAPGAWMVQAEWRHLLEDAVGRGRGAHWLSCLHLGVMRYHAGETEAAREAWEQSLALERSPWALRNLAVLAKHQAQPDKAADLWLAAAALQGHPEGDPFRIARGAALARDLLPLVIGCGQGLLDADRPQAWLDFLRTLSPPIRAAGRVRLLEAKAALMLGDLDAVQKILASDLVVADLREGEASLTDLWFGMHERRVAAAENTPIDDSLRARVRREFPPPPWLDFRMSGTSQGE